MRVDIQAFTYFGNWCFWKRLWDEINRDNCWGMAAQLSYYFLLALFPFLIFLSALAGFLPTGYQMAEGFAAEFGAFMPENSYQLVRRSVSALVLERSQGALTLGILSALWFASLAFNGMISLLNQAYQVPETRSYFRTRALSIIVTLIVSLFLLSSAIMLFFGDSLFGLRHAQGILGWIYGMARWLSIVLFMNLGVQIVYYALPAQRFPWRFISPGAVVATLGWIIGSIGFRFYVNRFANFQLLWGSLGALIALMIWFYICSFCLLLGGEIDSEIFKMRREGTCQEGNES